MATADQLARLDRALDRFAAASDDWTSVDAIAETELAVDQSLLGDLDRNLERLGVDPVGGPHSRITRSVRHTKLAAKALRPGSILSVLRRQDPDSYVEHTQKVDDRVFELPPFEAEFSVEAPGDIVADPRAEMFDRLVDTASSTDRIATRWATIQSELSSEADRLVDALVDFEESVDSLPHAELGHSDRYRAVGVTGQEPARSFDPSETEFRSEAYVASLDENLAEVGSTLETGEDVAPPTHLLRGDDGVEEFLDETFVAPVDTFAERVETLRSSVSEATELWSDLQEVVAAGDDLYAEWADHPNQAIADLNDRTQQSGPHVTTTTPYNLARLNQDSIVDANIWNGIEKEHLLGEVERAMTQALSDEAYVPLVETNRIAADGNWDVDRADYSRHRVHTTFLSRVFEESIDDVERDLDSGRLARDEIGISESLERVPANNQNTASRCVYAADWDFAATTFISGVFLDNIEPVRNGYRDAYRELVGDDGSSRSVDAAVTRHALGLGGQRDDVPAGSDGVYYGRDGFVDFDDPHNVLLNADPGAHTRYWEAVAEAILEEFGSTHGFDSTRAISDDE